MTHDDLRLTKQDGMALKDDIGKLIQLQDLDLEILNLNRQKNQEKPLILDKITQEFKLKKDSLKTFEDEYKEVQKRKKEKEIDLGSKEEAVRKAQGQLYQLKTNKEYDAKLKEINSFKSDVSIIEEDMLNILEEIDKKKEQLEQQKQKVSEIEKKYQQEKKQVEEDINKLDAEIKALAGKRDIFKKEISPGVLSKYEYILKNKQGLALVPLRNGSCGGCFLNLPPDVTNKVKQYSELVQCEMCARILYLADDFEL